LESATVVFSTVCDGLDDIQKDTGILVIQKKHQLWHRILLDEHLFPLNFDADAVIHFFDRNERNSLQFGQEHLPPHECSGCGGSH
jgi:hypothetical protein